MGWLTGWIKLHRKILNNLIFENEKLLKVFIWCLLKASHVEHYQLVGRQELLLTPGQFVTGRNKASIELGMPPSTVWDYLKLLEKYKCIEINSNNKFSIISVVKWRFHQTEDGKSNSKPDSKSTANRQQMDTNNNDKNLKNDIYITVVDYLNTKANKKFSATTKKTQILISERIKEGFNIQDFKNVIDMKVNHWINNNEMNKYLRPETLFGTKFESYLNETTINKSDINQEQSSWRGSEKRL